MRYKIIENQGTGVSEVFQLTSNKIVLQALIPSLERRIDELKAEAVEQFFIDKSAYGYRRIFGKHVLEGDVGAFIMRHEVDGFNYYDNGNSYKHLDVITGIKRDGTKITIKPLVCRYGQVGYVRPSDHKNYELLSLKDGILTYNEILRCDFQDELVDNRCGPLFRESKTLPVAKNTRTETKTLNLVEMLGERK